MYLGREHQAYVHFVDFMDACEGIFFNCERFTHFLFVIIL